MIINFWEGLGYSFMSIFLYECFNWLMEKRR
jgi:hypothetical protein